MRFPLNVLVFTKQLMFAVAGWGDLHPLITSRWLLLHLVTESAVPAQDSNYLNSHEGLKGNDACM